MTDVLKALQRASFMGIDFACESYSVKGGLRDSVHEYRHTPGGQVEIQGRKLYTFDFNSVFSASMPLYPNAWPGLWYELRLQFEAGAIGPLVVPTLGTIKAYCTDWPVDVDYRRMRDGLKAKLSFREDSTNLFATDGESFKAPSITAASGRLSEEVIAADVKDVLTGSKVNASIEVGSNTSVLTGSKVNDGLSFLAFFDAIFKLVAEVEALGSSYQLQTMSYLSTIDKLIGLVQRAEESFTRLNEPPSWRIVQALQGLGVAAILKREDALRKSAPIIDFPVTAMMSITDISVALYGDTSHAVEILLLNRAPIIPDAFSIRPGTTVKAYAPP